MTKYITVFVIGLCSFLLFAPTTIAADNGNGVDVNQRTYTSYYEWDATWFSNYNPTVTANFVYNESDEATDTAGEFETQFILDKATITIAIATLASTSVDFIIEGKNKNGEWFTIIEKTYSLAEVEAFPIINYYYGIRTGLKLTGAGSDDISVYGDFITKRRNQ